MMAWFRVAGVLLVALGIAGCTSGGPPPVAASPSPRAIAIAVTPCRDTPAPRAEPSPGGPVPAQSPEEASTLAAACAAEVRRGLDAMRAAGIFNADTVRRHLESLRLRNVEVRPAPGAAAGVVFGGEIAGWCVYGEHSSVRTVVEHGGPGPSGGCLR